MGGSAEEAAPVNIWQWKASRQVDAVEQRLHDVSLGDVGVPVDLYMFKEGDPVKGPLTEHEETFIPAWAVGNPLAAPELRQQVVLDFNAEGFGTLTPQPAEAQNVEGVGRWADGRWRVVMSRELAGDGAQDVDLSAPARRPVSFAVWDGAAGDRDGTKLISGWHWLGTPEQDEAQEAPRTTERRRGPVEAKR